MKKTFSIILMALLSSCLRDKTSCERFNNKLYCKTYKNGKIAEVKTFLGDDTTIKSGTFLRVSPSGDTLIKACYRTNKLIGSYYEYYKTGIPKLYICFDSFNEDTMFYRAYDSKGKISKEFGEVLYGKNYTSYDDQFLNKDSIFEVLSVIVAPPKSSTQIISFLLKPSSNDTIKPFKKYYDPYQNNLIFKTDFKINTLGSYKVFIVTDFHDSLKDYILRKSESYQFEFR